MEISYREAHPGEAQALLDYLKTVGGESDNLTFGAEGLPVTAEQEEAFLSGMQNNLNFLMLSAFDGDEIVGNASISRLPVPVLPTAGKLPSPSERATGAVALEAIC